jgi:hypothetical protein
MRSVCNAPQSGREQDPSKGAIWGSDRLQNVSTNRGEPRRLARSVEDEESTQKGAPLNNLRPQLARHQLVIESAENGFESRPPRHPTFALSAWDLAEVVDNIAWMGAR